MQPFGRSSTHLPHRMSILLAPMCMSRHVTVPAVTALLGSRISNASVVMSTAWSGALTQEGTGLAADGALVDFNTQYDGKGGRPAAHLVIAWPHGVPSVDAMVEAIHANGNFSVVSLLNAEMHNAPVMLPCLYATSMLQNLSWSRRGQLGRVTLSRLRDRAYKRWLAWRRIRDKAVRPSPLRLPPSGPGGTQRDLACAPSAAFS
eukprot:scaffold83073_cov78-Phaeocystis_antarctica.AAC.3